MKKSVLMIAALMVSAMLFGQYVVSDRYMIWFEDTEYEMTTRKPVFCTEDYQDLWNGDYVRIRNNRVYIYSGSYSILYGDEINLLYNGYYRVKRGNTWYLADPEGELVSGIYGKDIYFYPWGYVTVQRSSGYWDVFHCSGRKVEFYSEESPYLFGNGCWLIKQGTYWYACDQNGDKISGVYGDEVSLIRGRWKCRRGSYVTYVDE